jgi:uncharacterized protein (DUF433 family)
MIAEKVDLSKYIEMRNDRPNIRGRRLPIMTIINTQKATNYTVDELCYDYTLSRAQVLATLLYYQEHQEEMDRLEALDKQEEEELFARYARDDRK